MSTQAVVEAKCQEIYREAQTFFDQIPHSKYYGYKILNAPPLCRPRILFIGYQPGGVAKDFELETARGSDKHWPPTCEYATAPWILAIQMRKMFGCKFLEQCVGMNAIFLRSPNVKEYKDTYDKNTLAQIERFCLPRVEQIIEAIDPQKIVAISFCTLKLFGGGIPDLPNKEGKDLTRVGQIAGRPALATLHLSRAHITNPDRGLIRDRVLAW